jgi:hypothetical protein
MLNDLRHPSLRAKKYSEAEGRWQARVTGSWRFYFRIIGDTYVLTDIIPHPKYAFMISRIAARAKPESVECPGWDLKRKTPLMALKLLALLQARTATPAKKV